MQMFQINPEPAKWMEPVETIYQSLGGGKGTELTPKLPHLSEADGLFLGALVRTRRDNRPHGIITWASEVFKISRKGIYALGERIGERLYGGPMGSPSRASMSGVRGWIEVDKERIDRTILRAMFPGNVSIRATQQVVGEALGVKPSVGYISELRLEAGHRARAYLRQLDYKGTVYVIIGRDETYFGGMPILIILEPVSMTILLAEVCTDRQAETWGTGLQIIKEQGVRVEGLVEDMAQNYEKSQNLAGLSQAKVQKDTWHILRDCGNLRNQLEKTDSSLIRVNLSASTWLRMASFTVGEMASPSSKKRST